MPEGRRVPRGTDPGLRWDDGKGGFEHSAELQTAPYAPTSGGTAQERDAWSSFTGPPSSG